MWSIPPPSLTECEDLFESHRIAHLDQFYTDIFATIQSSPSSSIHTLPRTPLFPAFPSKLGEVLGAQTCLTEFLLPALHQARLVKTPAEIALMEKACAITSAAHTVVMRELGRYATTRAGDKTKLGEEEKGEVRRMDLGPKEWEIQAEGDAEAVFTAVCRRNESKHLACEFENFPLSLSLRFVDSQKIHPCKFVLRGFLFSFLSREPTTLKKKTVAFLLIERPANA